MSLVKMRSTGWTLSNLIDVLIKRGNLGTRREPHIYRRTTCEDKSRDWSADSISQGMPELASKPSEARSKAWNRFYFRAFRCQRYWDLYFRFLVSKTVRQYISVV